MDKGIERLAEETSRKLMALPDRLRNEIERQLIEAQKKFDVSIEPLNPYASSQDLFRKMSERLEKGLLTDKILKPIFEDYSKYDFQGSEYWKKRLKERKAADTTSRAVIQKCMIEDWENAINKKYLPWLKEQEKKYKDRFFSSVQRYANLALEIQKKASEYSVITGVFWDLSKETVSYTDLSTLKYWADVLQNNGSIKEFCSLLGRMKSESDSLAYIEEERAFPVFMPSCDSKSEITGVTTGSQIEYSIPHELATAASEIPEIALLFDKKYVEHQLLSYDFHGLVMEEERKNVQIEDKFQWRGPIIICVDTSGSMAGKPERYTKAITLNLAAMARKEKRNCLLINFSTEIEVFNFSEDNGISGLIRFLQMSFNGGTDAAPCLAYAANMISTRDFSKADVLMISDFVMDALPPSTLSEMVEARNLGARFFAFTIGHYMWLGNQRYFDNTWIWDPLNESIREFNVLVKKTLGGFF